MTALKKGDFVEVDFIGKVSSTNLVFDSTVERKEPVIVLIGSGMLLKAVDSSLEGKKVGDEYEVELKPEDAFGQRNPSMLQLVPLKTFREKDVAPIPGLQINIDGVLATIRSVSSGRVTIDFNHPLAGKALRFWIKIKREVTDIKEKIIALLKDWEPEVSIKEKEIEIKVDRKLPPKADEIKALQLKKMIPEIKDMQIKIIGKETKKKEEKPKTEEKIEAKK